MHFLFRYSIINLISVILHYYKIYPVKKDGKIMKTYGTYFQNDKNLPIKYGEINLINPERQRKVTK